MLNRFRFYVQKNKLLTCIKTIYKLTRLPSGMSCISYSLKAKYSPSKVCVKTPSTCTSHHSQLTGKPAHSVVSSICTICTVALKSNTFLARSTAHTTATLLLMRCRISRGSNTRARDNQVKIDGVFSCHNGFQKQIIIVTYLPIIMVKIIIIIWERIIIQLRNNEN